MATTVAAVIGPLVSWFTAVDREVTEPYLDEVFHVRQAQHYCAGRFNHWDGKITTPPGLYLVSTAVGPVLGCELRSLRLQSAISLIGTLLLTSLCLLTLSNKRTSTLSASHTALNIGLFPPLFFFSALYYTDVLSTFSVLLFYTLFLRLNAAGASLWLQSGILGALGLASLTFRQTNVFWVTLFPASISFIAEIDKGHDAIKDSMYRHVEGFGDTIYSVAKTSWKMEVIYDPPVRAASIYDYLRTAISVVVCTAKVGTQLPRLTSTIKRLAPYFTPLASFVAFVVWNGGVVLGDKGNHVATLHLPQMLYIWPYVAFFSWPILLSYLLLPPIALLAQLPQIRELEGMLIFKRRVLLPRWSLVAVGIIVMCLVTHFNTIVHPFTLADNRHYTFYVFRLLMRPWWMKYAITPIYLICGWASIQALGGGPVKTAAFESSPCERTETMSGNENTRGERARSSPLPLPDGTHSATTSFVLIWAGTSALQLITAPLVEPRYFILPWIFWRMHLPTQQSKREPSNLRNPRRLSDLVGALDLRLALETVWMLIVNAVTGYIFLNWGFRWPQEPGKVQRFMW